MPSKTKKQAKAMAAACKGYGALAIPRDVACEFHEADKRKRHKKNK